MLDYKNFEDANNSKKDRKMNTSRTLLFVFFFFKIIREGLFLDIELLSLGFVIFLLFFF